MSKASIPSALSPPSEEIAESQIPTIKIIEECLSSIASSSTSTLRKKTSTSAIENYFPFIENEIVDNSEIAGFNEKFDLKANNYSPQEIFLDEISTKKKSITNLGSSNTAVPSCGVFPVGMNSCAESLTDPFWSCHLCGKKNSGNYNRCSVCGRERKVEPEKSPSGLGKNLNAGEEKEKIQARKGETSIIIKSTKIFPKKELKKNKKKKDPQKLNNQPLKGKAACHASSVARERFQLAGDIGDFLSSLRSDICDLGSCGLKGAGLN